MTLSYQSWSANHIASSSATVDLSGTNESDVFEGLEPYEDFGIQCAWSSLVGPDATFEVRSSINGTDYDTVTGSSFTTSGASGSHTYNITGLSTSKIKVVVTSAATSGDLSVYLTANGANGKGRLKR